MCQFLRHYRATPHSTKDSSPVEMLFTRKIRTDIPPLKKTVTTHERFTKADSRDGRMKKYMEETMRSKAPNINISYTVLVKQIQRNKEELFLNPEPYTVTKTNGTMVTAKNVNHEITRNVSHFKKMPNSCEVLERRQKWICKHQ